jgi:hypothetical protein
MPPGILRGSRSYPTFRGIGKNSSLNDDVTVNLKNPEPQYAGIHFMETAAPRRNPEALR